MEAALPLVSFVTSFVTYLILGMLFVNALEFFTRVSPLEFFFGREWTPLFSPARFGVLPLVAGTALVSAIALGVSVPVGTVVAVVLSEYVSTRTRNLLKPVLDVLSGVPSIVFGYFALVFVTPLLRTFFPTIEVFNALSAGLVMGIMIVPLVATLVEESLAAVPAHIKEGALALGATRLETTLRVTIPSAMSGIVGAYVLAAGRAFGETMVVTMAAGATPRLTMNPLEGVQTLTAYIVQVSLGDTPYGSIGYFTLYAVGLVLFVISFGLSAFGRWMVRWSKTR